MYAPNLLRAGRWIIGGSVFVTVAAILFEAAGQSSPLPAPVRANAYRPIELDHRRPYSRHFALADQKKKNRSASAPR
jgi:hypothetical protein